MAFSAKAVLSGYTRRDGTQQLALRAVIDRKPATITMGICVDPRKFDEMRGLMKIKSPHADLINTQISEAVNRANRIYLEHKLAERTLTPRIFKAEYNDKASKTDFIEFMTREIELKKPKIETGTWKHHKSVLNKLSAFRSHITFNDLTVEFMQQYENHLINQFSNQANTIHKNFKTINHYLLIAESKGIKFKNPFRVYKVQEVNPSKPALSFDEVKQLFEYYISASAPQHHKKLLRYFLFSCTTGLRISDVRRIEWNNLHDNVLIFLPQKTKKGGKHLSIPLNEIQLSLLPEKVGKLIFDCFAEQVSNRYLKEVAEGTDIKKHLTYHISRHTFATNFLDRGGKLDTLQQLLGHAMITTTMKYVKVNEARKREEMHEVFKELKSK
jgi:integrase/recombinase XerD